MRGNAPARPVDAERRLQTILRARVKATQKAILSEARSAGLSIDAASPVVSQGASLSVQAQLAQLLMRIAPITDVEIALIRDLAEDIVNHGLTQALAQSPVFQSIPLTRGGLDVLSQAVDLWIEEVVILFESVPVKIVEDVTEQVITAQREGWSRKTLAAEIQARMGIPERRARIIAEDQAATLQAVTLQVRHEAAGITHYIWRTVGDSNVRDDHREREGKMFAYADPPPDGNPGEPIMCRCFAEPVIDPALEAEISEPLAPAEFRLSRYDPTDRPGIR